MEKYYTCAEIVARYGVNKQTVWQWIRQKKLPAIRLGNEYRIPESFLTKFENDRRTVRG